MVGEEGLPDPFPAAAQFAAVDHEGPPVGFPGQGAAHAAVHALHGEIDFTGDRDGGIGFRPAGAEGVPVAAFLGLPGEEPDPEAARPGHPGLHAGAGVAQINGDPFVRKGTEAFDELPLASPDGLFILDDFQHRGPPGTVLTRKPLPNPAASGTFRWPRQKRPGRGPPGRRTGARARSCPPL